MNSLPVFPFNSIFNKYSHHNHHQRLVIEIEVPSLVGSLMYLASITNMNVILKTGVERAGQRASPGRGGSAPPSLLVRRLGPSSSPSSSSPAAFRDHPHRLGFPFCFPCEKRTLIISSILWPARLVSRSKYKDSEQEQIMCFLFGFLCL